MNGKKLSRREAAALIVLPRFAQVLFGLGGAGTAFAASDPSDPEVLARVTFPNAKAFREAVRKHRIEVVRILDFDKPAGPVTALVLLRTSAYALVKQDATARAEIVAAPHTDPATIPQVGQGDRFANPHALPQGQGVLRSAR